MPEPSFITIVSGLPRSGTSMMMRMLEAGGLRVMTDGLREADDDNPRGYYEFEPVKRTKTDPSWLETAGGKAVKMVYQLLYDLPTGFEYRVIFMQRRLDEVLASQRKMLDRMGNTDDSIPDEKLAQLFKNQLQKFHTWIKAQPRFSLLTVDYNQLLADSSAELARIDAFLGGGLNREAMQAVVEPDLYRNRC